jgi:hypothetical protein
VDTDASEKRAWRCEEGQHVAGAKITWSSQSTLSPGLYRLRFRVRQEKPSTRGALHLTGSGDNGAAFDFVRPSDFHSAQKYQEFSLYWIYPFGEGHGFNWRFPGSGTYRFDHVSAEKVADLTMYEAWKVLGEGIDPVVVQAPGLMKAGKPVVFISGLTASYMGLESALSTPELQAKRYELKTMSRGVVGLSPELPLLDEVRLIIMADTPIRSFSPSEQLRIRKYVRDGGGLVIFGGLCAYGHGGMKGSIIEEFLPISIQQTFDRIRVPDGKNEMKENKNIYAKKFGACTWIHDVELKPKAEVDFKVGDYPAVVKGTFGLGRIVVVTATVLGEPNHPYWKEELWKKELASLIKWAATVN